MIRIIWFRNRQTTSKKAANNGQKSGKYSITTIPTEIKEDVLALREDGMLPSEIAEQYDLSPDQISKIIALEKRKIARRSAEVGGSDPIKEMEIQIKALELEKKKQEVQWALEDRQAERDEELADVAHAVTDYDNPITAVAMAFLSKLGSNQQSQINPMDHAAQQAPQYTGVNISQRINLSDEEIQQILDAYPQQVAQYQKLPDTVIKKGITSYLPNLEEDSLNRAVELIKKMQVTQ